MTTLRTRASKGSALTHSELDANFTRAVSQKTTTYSCLVSDNRSVIECNHASTPFTVTLGDAATMAAAETGDYEVTITNIGAAVVTVARAGSDTIDGGSDSISLSQNNSVTLKVNGSEDGYVTTARAGAANAILNVKVLDIGDWNMDATSTVTVAHGLTLANIRNISVLIRNDADTSYTEFTSIDDDGQINARYVLANSTNIELRRQTSGDFDGSDYDSTSFNRGWITIQYV